MTEHTALYRADVAGSLGEAPAGRDAAASAGGILGGLLDGIHRVRNRGDSAVGSQNDSAKEDREAEPQASSPGQHAGGDDEREPFSLDRPRAGNAEGQAPAVDQAQARERHSNLKQAASPESDSYSSQEPQQSPTGIERGGQEEAASPDKVGDSLDTRRS